MPRLSLRSLRLRERRFSVLAFWFQLVRVKNLTFMKELRDNHRCYVCGKENPAGLGVDFEIHNESRAISAKFTPSERYQGYEGIVHGGILSTLLDEAMGKLSVSLGIPAVTVELTVTFKSPAAPGEELFISGRLTKETNLSRPKRR